MKALQTIAAVALVLAALLGLGTLTASAQGPTSVAYLDTSSHSIPANSNQLYRFDYALKDDGTRPITTIRLANGTNSGISFAIWTADQLRAMANNAADAQTDPTHNMPIGRGTPATINCDTGVLDGSGACQSPDLVWSGAFGSSGTYYVQVMNDTNKQGNFQLNIQGSGVSLGQPLQANATSPTVNQPQPAAAPPLAATTADPSKAAAIDGQQHNLAAGAAAWYRFTYALKDDGTRPLVTLRLVNGTMSGTNFEIWTADQLHAMANNVADAQADLTHNQPIGRGTAARINCDTGALDGSGACLSPDLTWTGTFGSNGDYFVKVINNNNNVNGSYQLLMTQQPALSTQSAVTGQ